MAANLAVIATAVGGNLDAIVDNESGILVPPRDPSALAAALARLASDPDIRRRYGDAARRRVEQRFALERCVDRYERLYRAMCEPDPRPLAEILADDGGVSVRRPLEHDPEKRKPIFGKDHAQTMSSREMSIQPKIISL
jgi:hypothetical protein